MRLRVGAKLRSNLLSFNAGYADTLGYLALHGLFTAHVTGNFVTLGAVAAAGASGLVGKVLALPVFCLVVVGTRLVSVRLDAARWPVLRWLVGVQMALLALAAGLAIFHGPFPDADALPALTVGMVMVAAMAVQNAYQRTRLASEPPTTIMTGNTTQIMIDLADWMRGAPEAKTPAARGRLARMSQAALSFAVGCGAAAVLFTHVAAVAFLVPPLLVLVVLVRAAEEAG